MSVDAPVQFHALLYMPEKAPLDLFANEREGSASTPSACSSSRTATSSRRTYLRFVRGVVDSEDLPLNVSREMLQEDRRPRARSSSSSPRACSRAEESSPRARPISTSSSGASSAGCSRKGVTSTGSTRTRSPRSAVSSRSRPRRASSSRSPSTSTAMPADQKEIYYVTGPSRRAVEQGPHLEALKKRGYDVLLLTDPVDEWVVQVALEFDKRSSKSAAHGEVDLGDEPDDEGRRRGDRRRSSSESALGDKVKEVRLSRRLTDSASCLVAEEGDPGANMRAHHENDSMARPRMSREFSSSTRTRHHQEPERLGQSEPRFAAPRGVVRAAARSGAPRRRGPQGSSRPHEAHSRLAHRSFGVGVGLDDVEEGARGASHESQLLARRPSPARRVVLHRAHGRGLPVVDLQCPKAS